MRIHYVSMAVEAEDGVPVDEMIEEFVYKQGWKIVDPPDFDDEDEEL